MKTRKAGKLQHREKKECGEIARTRDAHIRTVQTDTRRDHAGQEAGRKRESEKTKKRQRKMNKPYELKHEGKKTAELAKITKNYKHQPPVGASKDKHDRKE